MLDMMGHMSPGTMRRYSHMRANARREAITAVESRASAWVPPKPPQEAALRKRSKPQVI